MELLRIEDTWIQLGIAIGIFLLFLLMRKIFAKYIYNLVLKLSRKSSNEFFTHLFLAFERPLRMLFVIIGLNISVRYVSFLDHHNELFNDIMSSSLIFLAAWGLYNLSSASSLFFQTMNTKYNLKIDQLLIPFLSKTLRLLIVAMTFSVIAGEFGYDVNGFITGLGLGGLAFALAAKETIENFFGGIVIITEKPFSIGEWIKTPSVEGVVEDITFRSTKIRTFAQALVTVPNARLANENITNWSKMGKRQITFHLGVTYNTPSERLETCITRIEKMLRDHDEIHPETIFVSFDEFNHSSLDIFLYFFTNTTTWGDFLNVKQDVNFKIMKIMEEEQVSFAFPTQTLHVENARSHEEEKMYS
ncbi:mechanosensitive ion channel family protein [Bacillus sp. N1-1]|jgi:MscS family membrane protein|uniref:mechanosensitive ion channel family protein n=1 Tax=Bacillus sp. N1-1 TaxID=2682541 RepID=UPI001316E745|nr:mechanosensitive ion channel family protein [Bacillus sp. N1-1]QHA90457.1 mechanosensitive ion channel [Bacillus sp. N1-1]